MVAKPLYADPLILGVQPRWDCSCREAIRRHRGLPPLLEEQYGDREGAGNQKGR